MPSTWPTRHRRSAANSLPSSTPPVSWTSEPVSELMTFRGGSTAAQMYITSMEQLRPALLAVGATEDQLEELPRVMSDPTNWFTGFAIYSVRGRVPAV